MNIVEALHYGREILASSVSPEADTQVLLCHVLNCQTTYLHTWPDKQITAEQQTQYKQLIAKREQGHPVAHLTELRGFWSLDLKVTPATLIPRPDTELLVTLALNKLKPKMLVADLGTGTGAVALSLAIETPGARIVAMDFSKDALDIAQQNAHSNNINNISFWQGSWLDAIMESSLDMIVSNPPYIEQNDPHLSQGDVRFEPISALASGVDGLDDIRIIIRQAQCCLKKGGWLLIEHGYHQAEKIQQLFQHSGFMNVSSHQDYGDNDRVVMGQISV